MAKKTAKNPNGAGRKPVVLAEKTVEKLVAAFQRDYTTEEACDYAEIDKSSFYNHYIVDLEKLDDLPAFLKESGRTEEDVKFTKRIDRAKRYIFQRAKANLAESIESGDTSDSKFVLAKRQSSRYSERSEVTGKGGESLGDLSVLKAVAEALTNAKPRETDSGSTSDAGEPATPGDSEALS